MSSIEKIFEAAKQMGMNDKQAKSFTYIIASKEAETIGNAKACNHFEIKLAELGVK